MPEPIVAAYQSLSTYFDSVASVRDRWIERNAGYNREVARVISQHVPAGSRVLEIGCATGHLLQSLQPSHGVGIDMSSGMVEEARRRRPGLRFERGFAETFRTTEKFDHVIMVDTIGFIRDIEATLENIRHACTDETRLIITTYNFLWWPFLKVLEKIGLKMPQPQCSWISPRELENLLRLADFEIIKMSQASVLPFRLPIFGRLINRIFSQLPFFRRFCVIQYVVARPLHLAARQERSVSVIVPARNEAGNIEAIINEIPPLGTDTEIIFVEGNSRDNTWEEILSAIKRHPERKILSAQQKGKGKWDAVQVGFEKASGDILMIYDADRTVPAADLVKFYEAIASNRAEFVSGDRFVYPMEHAAMPFFNVLGNRFFAAIFSWLLNQRIQDTLCGTKVLLRSNFKRLDAQLDIFGHIDPFGDYDLILGAAKLNLRFATIPIRYGSRTYGTSNISPWTDSLLLLKICWIAVRRLKFI